MITKHQYLHKYPIPKDSEKLIVGTIHPHNHENFLLPFFYGSTLNIWSILNEAYNNEMGEKINLESLLNFLKKHKIAVSDTILECKRRNPTALDEDLLPLKLNKDIVDQIKNSNIREIFFTSGFQKTSAFKLFYVDILGLKITQEIRRDRGITLDKAVFGRPVKLTILYSPSGASNMGLSRNKVYLENKYKYLSSSRPVFDFKVDYYRNSFKN
jgi:G:T/U-mismatch repair DNA glycosylase